MASRAEVDAFRAALAALSSRARRDLRRVWAPIAGADFQVQRPILEAIWPDMIAAYGDLGVSIAADMIEEWGATPIMVRPVDEERANARMRWAIGTAVPLGNLEVILDELVKQPARSTIARSAEESDDFRYARVPYGDTCAFCIMMASRGAVYKSRVSAGGDGRKYHGDCDCTPVLVRSDDDLPSGYNPDALYEDYLSAQRKAESGSSGDILAAMRQEQGIN